MREIKYRAWYEEGGYIMLTWEQLKSEADFSWFADEDLVFMQYTGVKDENGVEIYTGDIVRYFKNELAVIVYRNGGVDIRSLNWKECEPLQRRLGEIEVIGNIYQNKDLLEVK